MSRDAGDEGDAAHGDTLKNEMGKGGGDSTRTARKSDVRVMKILRRYRGERERAEDGYL